MFIFEQLELFQFIFDNFKTSTFEQLNFDNYVSKSQIRIDISRVKKNFEIVLKFHIHIFRRFNSIRLNSNFFFQIHIVIEIWMNSFVKNDFILIVNISIVNVINNINKSFNILFNISFNILWIIQITQIYLSKWIFLFKHQLIHSNKFDELKYLQSKIRELKRSFQFDEH